MTNDSETPEQMATDWYIRLLKEEPAVAIKEAYQAGYQAAKDTYKEAISAYEDVAKQMLEEAVRIMSPKDQLADADKVVTNMEAFAEVLYADMPMAKEAFLRGYRETKAKLNTIQPLWISVKERLPKNDELVLIYQPEAGSWVSSHDESGWGMWENGLTCEPTYWMPLPEAPKEEK